MNIYIVHNNFTPVAGNKLLNPALIKGSPVFYSLPETALLRGGKPFFVPDFAVPCSYQAGLVLRICRLGRSVSVRFARRYYDAVSVGVSFTSDTLYQQCRDYGLPWDMAKGFDGAAAVGEFRPLREEENADALQFTLEADGKTVQSGTNVAAAFTADEVVSYISQFCLLRQGDLIYLGFPCPSGIVRLDSRLTATLNGDKVLGFNVK